MFSLRPEQVALKSDILAAFEHHQNVLAVLPTGGGKTVIFSDIVREFTANGYTCWAIAHRKELVGQISLALANQGVSHKIIGPQSLVRYCRNRHLAALGASFIRENNRNAVVSVDTLASRIDQLRGEASGVNLWVQDEAHHVLRENKWGKVIELFPRARGLGVTATPLRADGKGLGREASGVFDTLIEGPRMAELVETGKLCKYRIACSPTALIDISSVSISSATGDYKHGELVKAVRRTPSLFGNMISNYRKLAHGKSAIAFITDVDTAGHLAEDFRNAGISAMALSAKTADNVRDEAIERFKTRRLQILVNVGLFDEGFDVPGVEAVLDGAPTCSLARFDQKFGRMMRVSQGKDYGLYLDFAGNVARHYPPDSSILVNPARDWSLADRERRQKAEPDVIPSRYCPNCTAPYPRIYKACPYCGHTVIPQARANPEVVDGDLLEVDPETLIKLRTGIETDVDRVRANMEAASAPIPAIAGAVARIRKRNRLRLDLGGVIEAWGIKQQRSGFSASEAYRLFYHRFGLDVLTAQLKTGPETTALYERIKGDL
jgi:DNA repair protein RadD